ncbi:hypothetical protein A3H03_03280 [Candidatus Kuenenbacteria bacterium RIFCSPLOWO2_12_FULL_42_13]|uniref:Uncharacterized protein n=4 Tax=Candidatus Kueneniibacteriota TaxID=1752740 RepID=A0A0G0YTV8_9BACT|nr:MAG: hypothetical protein UV02_C0048G0004 [Candidatus Kuenenbacteria bacterium GW2011_GWA2_42_15]OGG90762.1 MAG: hypothetical protein A3H55_00065 [Candidatus Kuenenbacteria bacterium RIFCSPLOWO2_02_FULL_42_16]OGG92488.1 MAG: hypothetical protein A3H03_03280 [Candidatus Kuenenbacteria bacterium RIFCSPLOWO2_12_FULL_42_13]OGH00891.1 MAG: hypothetical protein A3E04_03020 [Candidatus Kuenenbacteria bacterium RIFCSPHIGHO2_12_FULL_42_14]
MSQNNLINAVENWLLNYQDILEAKKEESRHGSRIVVSDAASRLAFIYEKIRNTVDYREDHLLRRYATARILRRIATPGNKGSDLARPLIEELIRARYLANNAVPEQMIEKVSHLINKYIVIYNVIIDSNYPPKEMKGFFNWLINLAACEVEEALVPSGEEKILVEVVERTIKQNLVFDGNCHLDEQGKNIQVYVAILKSLLKADEMTVNYFLLKYYFPEWHDLTLPEAERAAHDVKCSQGIIKENFNHHLNDKLVREFKKYTAVFWILQDIVQSNPEEYLNIFSKKEKLLEKVEQTCREKYGQIGARVRRAIVRSVIYIFCTKIIFGILLELPFDYFILNELRWPPLVINALFPPALMAAIGMSIRVPGANNTASIKKEVENIVYGDDSGELRVKIMKSKKGFLNVLLNFFYAIMYLVSFGLVVYGLLRLNFSAASIAIFLLFLTVVSFFSLRIRRTAAELIILEQKERFLTIIIAFLFVPILRVGRWIAMHSSKINVFIFVLDFIIEAPFKIFVRIFEDLVIFIKEKRDEMM